MRVIGVTGGVGAGKSTVLGILEKEFQAYVIQADQLGHILMEPGEECYDAVIALFGKEIIKKDKTIDRRRISDVVFTDKDDYELYLNEYAAIGDPGEVVAGMFDGTWGNNIDTPQEILDLFEQGRKTTDVEKRTEIYKELQEKAMESYLTYPIAYPNYCFATSDNLEGAETYSTTPVFEDYTKLSFK